MVDDYAKKPVAAKPKTGDEQNLPFYSAVLTISGTLLLLLGKRRKNTSEN